MSNHNHAPQKQNGGPMPTVTLWDDLDKYFVLRLRDECLFEIPDRDMGAVLKNINLTIKEETRCQK